MCVTNLYIDLDKEKNDYATIGNMNIEIKKLLFKFLLTHFVILLKYNSEPLF